MSRLVCRLVLAVFGSRVLRLQGLENISPRQDPFIVAFNHTTLYEALVVPSAMYFCREGKLVHFFADWNYLLYPGLGYVMRRGEPVVVTRKPARPRILNLLRPLYTHPVPSLERGRRLLEQGRSLGIFPEGTVNPDPRNLLMGDRGAAWLSLATGAPVVPGGIRFPEHTGDGPVAGSSRLEVEFGRPLRPGPELAGRDGELSAVKSWHAQIMRGISRLSGKTWSPQPMRRKHAHP
jgi:1-acyl-sn-glycerol-3-phosphate acyltransferase